MILWVSWAQCSGWISSSRFQLDCITWGYFWIYDEPNIQSAHSYKLQTSQVQGVEKPSLNGWHQRISDPFKDLFSWSVLCCDDRMPKSGWFKEWRFIFYGSGIWETQDQGGGHWHDPLGFHYIIPQYRGEGQEREGRGEVGGDIHPHTHPFQRYRETETETHELPPTTHFYSNDIDPLMSAECSRASCLWTVSF